MACCPGCCSQTLSSGAEPGWKTWQAAALERFPQVLQNVPVSDKEALAGAGTVWEEVRQVEQSLGRNARVLLRPSGTEPLVRVMVEAPTQQEAEAAAQRIVSALRTALGASPATH